jgi:hypothetical protein
VGSGGSRNRSGPSVDPKSGRSDARGLKFMALPREGFRGDVPEFPLPNALGREVEVWESAWRTPQAAAWAVESWRWRTVALWVRVSVRVEDPEAPAALLGHVHRFADQIGLTPAGMRENGWALADDEVQEKRDEKPAATSQAAPKRRLRAVGGD